MYVELNHIFFEYIPFRSPARAQHYFERQRQAPARRSAVDQTASQSNQIEQLGGRSAADHEQRGRYRRFKRWPATANGKKKNRKTVKKKLMRVSERKAPTWMKRKWKEEEHLIWIAMHVLVRVISGEKIEKRGPGLREIYLTTSDLNSNVCMFTRFCMFFRSLPPFTFWFVNRPRTKLALPL